MDRHTCKLCSRGFPNGRALGGHMRSHVVSATAMAATTKAPLQDFSPSPSSSSVSHGGQAAADPAAPPEAEEAEVAGAGEAKQLAYYGLRENPRKSCRLVDPEFSSTFAAATGPSVVLQDGESETESSKPPPPPLRRRSIRRSRGALPRPPLPQHNPDPSFDPEPLSSVSDATSEEDVARCLMMLSRDVWTAPKRRKTRGGEGTGEEEDDEEEDDEGGEEEQQQEQRQLVDGSEGDPAGVTRSRRGGRRRYQCGTCGKVFRSYQALGGHRASHKNARTCAAAPPAPARAHVEVVVLEEEREEEEDYKHGHGHLGRRTQDADCSEVNAAFAADRRVHECPVCFRVFGSGQALGGHKRSHLAYSSSAPNPSVLLSSSSKAPAFAASNYAAGNITASGGGGGGGGGSHVGMSFSNMFAGESLIDLNLPAPMDDEAEMSSVFDTDQ